MENECKLCKDHTDFCISCFIKRDIEENPEVYEAFSIDEDECDVTREKYNY